MADVFKSFATEEELNSYNQEIKVSQLTELGFDTLEALQEKLNANPDETLSAENVRLSEELNALKTNSEKALIELKRELSGKLGINLFEDGTLDAFLSDIKTNKELVDSLNTEKQALVAEKNAIDIENNLLKVGIQAKRVERAKGLIESDMANGKSAKEAVDALLNEFPEWFGGAGAIGANLNPDNSNLTGREKYYQDQGYTK